MLHSISKASWVIHYSVLVDYCLEVWISVRGRKVVVRPSWVSHFSKVFSTTFYHAFQNSQSGLLQVLEMGCTTCLSVRWWVSPEYCCVFYLYFSCVPICFHKVCTYYCIRITFILSWNYHFSCSVFTKSHNGLILQTLNSISSLRFLKAMMVT